MIIKKVFKKKHYTPKKLKLNSYNQYLFFGTFGLITTEKGQLNIKQLNTIKKIILRKIKVKGLKVTQFFLRIFPIIEVTKKPLETRMGKGVGSFNHCIAHFNANDILFELNGTSYEILLELIPLLNGILPFRITIISNFTYES